MDKVAVDVVLLPYQEMMDRAIEANRRLSETSDNKIKLNKIDCFPHITLAMGCIKEDDIEEIGKILENIAEKFEAFNLKTIAGTEQKAWFEIKNNKKLQLLHETVMDELAPYFTYDIKKHMLYNSGNEEINELTLNYIRNFPCESSFENYKPHITIGSRDAEIALPKIEFTASELAMYHLGNYCTCRKNLLSTAFRQK